MNTRIRYEYTETNPKFVEQSNRPNSVLFIDWGEDDVLLAVDGMTVCLWYEKNNRPNFKHKRND